MKLTKQISILFVLATMNTWVVASEEATINWTSVEEIKDLMELQLHPEYGEVTYGPNFALSDRLLLANFSNIYLVRVVDPEDEESYMLYITVVHNDDDWRIYEHAKKGRSILPLAVLAKNKDILVDNITYKFEEKLAIAFDFADIIDAAFSGTYVDLTISGKKNNNIKIPSSYFQAVLQTM